MLRLLRSTAATTMAVGLAGQGLLFVTSVITARLLGPGDRGLLALAALGPTALTMVATLGVPVGVTYYLARTEDPARAERYRAAAVSLAVLLGLALSVLYAVGLFFATPLLPEGGKAALWLSLGAVGPLSVVTILTAIAQAAPGLRFFNILRLLPVLGYALLLVVLVARGGTSLEAVTAVWVIAYVFALVVGAVVLVGRRVPQVRGLAREVRDIMRYGLASYVGALGSSDAQRLLEQAIVVVMLSPTDLGLWVVAVSPTLALSLPARNIRLLAFPDVARTRSRLEADRKVRRYFLLTAVLIGLLAAVIGASAVPLVTFVFGEEFRDAAFVVPLLVAATWLRAMRQSAADSLRAMGVPSPGTTGEGVSFLAAAVGLLMLLPKYGLVGGGWALLGAASLAAVAQAIVHLRVVHGRL